MINEFKGPGSFYSSWGLTFVLIFMLLFQLGFAFVAIFSAGISFDVSIDTVQNLLKTPDGSALAINIARLTNAISFIGAMLLPPLLFSYINKTGPVKEGGLNKPIIIPKLFLALILTALSIPLADFFTNIMHQLPLPSWLEYWALQLDQSRQGMMDTILEMHQIGELIVCLLLLAALPALLEEFMFRGVILNILRKMSGSNWFAVFIQAIIFAVLHLSFYELPGILLMGILFGTIAMYTGTIWYGVFMHFCFNSTSVILTWMNQRAFDTTGVYGKFENIPFSPLLAFAAIAGILLILKLWKREIKKENILDHE